MGIGPGLDPKNPDDAWFDSDGDGVINLFEFQLGADPNNPASPPVATVGPVGADFATIRQAIDGVAPGTLIRVAGGIYEENYLAFSEKIVMLQGGWSEDFSERDLRRFPTIVDGRMQGEVLYFAPNSGNSAVILDGINLIRGSGPFGAVNLLALGTATLKTSIVNCTIMQSRSAEEFGGVLNMHAWGSSASDRTVANTMLVGNAGSGIYSQNTQDGCNHWRIIHSTISGNTNGGGRNGHGIDAFTLDNGSLTARIYNSIVWGNAPSQFDISIVFDNLVFDVDHTDINRVRADFGALLRLGPGNLNVDPAFVDPVSGDYHLRPESPVREGGVSIGIPLTDFEGNPRPRVAGGSPDLGAHEIVDEPELSPRR